MPISPRTYEGMRDHLPDAMRLRRFITDTIIAILERHGFETISTPIIEYSETLEGKIGEDEKMLFRLENGKGTLRFDQTVSLARVVAQYENDLPLPFKRYALGQSYRGERQQQDRYRELWQLDVDIVGVNSPIADAEIIAIVSAALRALGFGGAKILINHRAILSGLARVAGVPEETAGDVYRAIDKLDKIGMDGVRGELLKSAISEESAGQILRLISLEGSSAEVLDEMERLLGADPASAAALANLRQILAALISMGVDPESYIVAPSLARGLSYYTGCVFEAVMPPLVKGSLLGGGRYDNLIGMFSKRSLPTVGMAFGIERLHNLMLKLNMAPPVERVVDAYVTIFDASLVDESLRLAGELRAAGFATLTAYAPAKLGAQFKEADRKRATLALVIGPDDMAAGVVQVKDLRSGTQRSVERAGVVAALGEALGR